MRVRVVVEGGKETRGFDLSRKEVHPPNYTWILFRPGELHLMWYFGRAITSRFWGAGLELVVN